MCHYNSWLASHYIGISWLHYADTPVATGWLSASYITYYASAEGYEG